MLGLQANNYYTASMTFFEILTGGKMPPSFILKNSEAGAMAWNIILLVRTLYDVKIV